MWRPLGVVLVLFAASSASAQQPAPDVMGGERRPSWGLNTSLGFGDMGGDFGGLLDEAVAGDFSIFRNHRKWRFGMGISFTSFTMPEPYQEEDEWGFQETYLSATRMLGSEQARFRPYLQARGGLARLHPRSELFAFSPPPEEKGDSPTHPANGFSVALVPGFEARINKALALDVSAKLGYFDVSEYDLSPVGYPNASSGTTWDARIGVRWHPDNGWPAGPAEPGSPPEKRDAWGVGQNLGWGIAEALAINWVASGSNEYTRNANFNQISPRSWWANFEHGFTYDDNQFKTNQYIHPWNGAMYYNSGRSNGFNYWESALFALGGAFFWECCGETHPMSYNDMISTAIGGIAVGEQMYRLSSQLLDNTAKGKERFFREAGSFIIAPVRGFNRGVSGRWTAQHPNPEEPLDWRPQAARFVVFAGARVIGEGESITEDTKTYGFVGLAHTFGSVFDNERRRPFDSMVSDYQFSIGEKQPRTLLRIRGDIFSRPLGGGERPTYAWAIVQHFDYYNNLAYEFGQQAFGPSFFARYRLSDSWGLGLRVDGMLSPLAAVNADYSFLADVANRERFREYDYGPSLGGGAEARISRKDRNLLSLSYRVHWITVRNGSIFNQDDERGLEGSDAEHTVQAAGFRLMLPVYKALGLGSDGIVVLRNSSYSDPRLRDRTQRNPEVRVYMALDLGK
jgi:hypothetical protein